MGEGKILSAARRGRLCMEETKASPGGISLGAMLVPAARAIAPPAPTRRSTGGFAAKEGSVAHICESPRGKGCRNVRPTVGKDRESRRKERKARKEAGDAPCAQTWRGADGRTLKER